MRSQCGEGMRIPWPRIGLCRTRTHLLFHCPVTVSINGRPLDPNVIITYGAVNNYLGMGNEMRGLEVLAI